VKLFGRSAVMIVVFVMMAGALSGAALAGTAYVNLQAVLEQHPGLEDAQAEYQEAAQELEEEMGDVAEEDQEAMMGQYQQMLQQLEQDLQMGLVDDIIDAVEELGEQEGYDTILDESAVLYGGTDVTDEVIDHLLATY